MMSGFRPEQKGTVYLKEKVHDMPSPLAGRIVYSQNGVNIEVEKQRYFVPYTNILLIEAIEEAEKIY